MTAGAGSMASRIRRTGAPGSPQTRPTASQSRAQAGSYMRSRTAMTSAREGEAASVVTLRPVSGTARSWVATWAGCSTSVQSHSGGRGGALPQHQLGGDQDVAADPAGADAVADPVHQHVHTAPADPLEVLPDRGQRRPEVAGLGHV